MSAQQADQTPLVYPVSEPNPPSHRHSDGSFRAVFVVLAVIMVVSAIACCLGRLCNNRYKLKPSAHGRLTKGKDRKANRNTFPTKDGDIEVGFDKRFSSAKVAANEPNMGPNMGRANSFREPNMGPDMRRANMFHEPNMGPDVGRANMFHEPNMGPDMGRANMFHETNMGPDMGRANMFREPNMGSDMGRANMFREPNMGPILGRPNSFNEPSTGRVGSFQEPSTGRANSFHKGEFSNDQMGFGGTEDHVVKFNSGTRPQYY